MFCVWKSFYTGILFVQYMHVLSSCVLFLLYAQIYLTHLLEYFFCKSYCALDKNTRLGFEHQMYAFKPQECYWAMGGSLSNLFILAILVTCVRHVVYLLS